MMHHGFVIDKNTEATLKGKSLLLDTNVLLDAYRLPAEFYDLTKQFIELNCDFITTKTIITEFLGGTSDEKNLQKKADFLELLFGKKLETTFLPLDRTGPNLQEILSFSRQANRFTAADYELYCTLRKYGSRTALVSRNHKDFSTSLAARISFITLLGKSEIHTYGVYEAEQAVLAIPHRKTTVLEIPF